MHPAGLALFLVLQSGAPDAYLAGRTCFEQLDYRCAVELLTAAARDPRFRAEPGRLVEIYRLLAESHLALRQRQQAVAAFVELLRIKDDYRPDPATTSPKLLDALDEARRRLAATPPGVTAGRQPAASRLALRLVPAAQLLVGRDAELLQPGACIDLGAELRLGRHWLLAATLRYAFHQTRDGQHTVHLAGAWAAAGPGFELGNWRLGLLAGLGAVRFGVIDREGKSALLLPLLVQLDYRLGPWHAGLVLGPGWLLTLESNPRSSLLLDLGLRFTVEM